MGPFHNKNFYFRAEPLGEAFSEDSTTAKPYHKNTHYIIASPSELATGFNASIGAKYTVIIGTVISEFSAIDCYVRLTLITVYEYEMGRNYL